ncbi:hypothetical protein H0H87_004159 [Tephrocybe sp. NHM501043]|nr:hypothetical protein H0H87_004159 [Tephrocybe sp. NHM501043]
MQPLTPTRTPEQLNVPFRIKALDTLTAANYINSLKAATGSLGNIFGKLESQTKETAIQGGASEIQRFERLAKEQNQIHKDGIVEINRRCFDCSSSFFTDTSNQVILKDYLNTQLLEHLKEQAQREIEAEIDELVQKEVTRCLETMIPQNLQDEVAGQKVELEGLRKELLNSNMFSGSPLNRLSWLRTSHPFLNAIIASPSTRWLVFNAGQPLVLANSDTLHRQSLVFLTTKDVKPLLGPEPYFGQNKEIGQLVVEPPDVQHSPTEAARHHSSPVVFLGLKENSKTSALPSSEFVDAEAAIANLDGTPYFSMDVADLDLSPERLNEVLQATEPAQNGQVLSWSEPRVLMTGLDSFSGAVFAEARSLVDWNQRNKVSSISSRQFCAGCGSPTYSMWGGWKLSCSSLLPWADNTGRKPCPTTKGLHNFTHPRTDPVVIMIAIDESGDKVLLGRGKKFPGKFNSALAGFIEPGETFEDAVAREMWEEAGVSVWDIKYHSGQPWPYPANLMVGFYAKADSSQPIRVDLDNELVDARWFSRSEILDVLGHPIGGKFGSNEYRKMAESTEGRNSNNQQTPHLNPTYEDKPAAGVKRDDPPFRLPPATAIAGMLIRDWVEEKIGFPSASISISEAGTPNGGGDNNVDGAVI